MSAQPTMSPEERVRRALDVPLVRALGCALIDPAAPAAGVRLIVGPAADNGVGGAHTAALTATMELAAYLAAAPALADTEHAVTNSCSLQLMRSTPPEAVVHASGQLDHRTKRLAFVTVTATCGDDVIARLQVTKSIVTLR